MNLHLNFYMENILLSEKSILRNSTRSKILFGGGESYVHKYTHYVKESASTILMVFLWNFYAFWESVHKILLLEHNEDQEQRVSS